MAPFTNSRAEPLNFAGNGANAQAYYPNTAHASLSAADNPGTTYPGSREVINYAQQRGGKCGVIADTNVNISLHLGLSVNIYEYSTTDGYTAYYQPVANCNTKCHHGQVTGPLRPFYKWVVENYRWFAYSTNPTGYFCVSFTAGLTNNDLTGQQCYDRGYPF